MNVKMTNMSRELYYLNEYRLRNTILIYTLNTGRYEYNSNLHAEYWKIRTSILYSRVYPISDR